MVRYQFHRKINSELNFHSHMKQRRPVPSWGIPHQSWSASANSLMSGWVLWSHRGTRFLVMSQKHSVGERSRDSAGHGRIMILLNCRRTRTTRAQNGLFRYRLERWLHSHADGHRAQLQQANDTLLLSPVTFPWQMWSYVPTPPHPRQQTVTLPPP